MNSAWAETGPRPQPAGSAQRPSWPARLAYVRRRGRRRLAGGGGGGGGVAPMA
jgi:hypothetical protein